MFACFLLLTYLNLPETRLDLAVDISTKQIIDFLLISKVPYVTSSNQHMCPTGVVKCLFVLINLYKSSNGMQSALGR